MQLNPGTRLGPYEILSPLGAGGMGEVFRARDTRLGREVAIKVLPQHLSSHPEVRARFEREAKTVSSLNHSNICTLFDIGREGDTDYLVMELIEGETLARRLEKGLLPIEQALAIGAQIAEALTRAHRAGVVHRDLKPGNVMLTKSGAKLMDFGLARATGLAEPVGALTQSPTIAQPLTAEGTIVGTFQYMSPEQLEGREADARSDVWALGCVLYEMATGKRAFEAKSQASLIAAILEHEPAPIADVQPMSPPELDRLVRACLAKDPDERVQTAHDVKLQLGWMRAGIGAARSASAPLRSGTRRARWMVASFAALAVVAASAFVAGRRSTPPGRCAAGAVSAENLPDTEHLHRALHARRQDDRAERRAGGQPHGAVRDPARVPRAAAAGCAGRAPSWPCRRAASWRFSTTRASPATIACSRGRWPACRSRARRRAS